MNQSYQVLNNQYAIYLQTLGFSKSVVYNYPKMVRWFLDYLHNQRVERIHFLTTNHVNGYISYLQSRSNMYKQQALSVPHLNKSVDALDKFLMFLHAQGCANVPSPTGFRVSSFDESIPNVLDPSDIKLLYECCENLFPQMPLQQSAPRRALATLILDLCYGCGLRKSEAFKLAVADVDLDKKILLIRQAKGYKDRYVPLSEIIVKRLQLFIYEYRRDFKVTHKRVFPLTSPESMVHYIRLLRKESKLDFGLHTLRHSIATHLLQNGMSVEQIAQFLGHSSLESTQIYTHLIDEKL